MFDVDPYPQIATMREVRPFWEPKWWDLCMAQLMLRDTHWFTVWPHSDMRHLGGVAKTWHFSFWLFGIWFGSWIENGLPPCLKLNTAHLKRLAVQIFCNTHFFGGTFAAVISFEKNSQSFFQQPSSGWYKWRGRDHSLGMDRPWHLKSPDTCTGGIMVATPLSASAEIFGVWKLRTLRCFG